MVDFTAGAVLTAANLNTSLNQLTIRTVTGVSDTLVIADQGGAVSYSNASATTSTIPPNSSVAFAVGTKIVLINLGAGVVTVTAGAGVTVNGAILTLAQNAGGTCIKTATNTWSFLPFSSGVGAANFSNAATGTYTGFKYLTFTASGTITVTTAGFADIVVVAGGGSGGSSSVSNSAAGGGGAGGNLQITNAYLPAGTLTVTIGAGGAGVATSGTGKSGITTRIGSYFSPGGGDGGGNNQRSAGGNGASGGGGGGGGNSNLPGGTATPTLGNDGGIGTPTGANNCGGGGGGAGAVGNPGVAPTTGGAGGAGTTTSIAGTTPTGAYVAGNYAICGGGGGAATTGGAAGSGGGTAGVTGTNTSAAAAANTGGGSGGGYASGNGGSGIVIVRVAV